MKIRNKKTGKIRTLDVHYIAGKNYESLAEIFAEWEDYEGPKEHWCINEFGTPEMAGRFNRENIYDKSRKIIGNDFTTKEEAEKAVEKLKAWKRLKDKDFQFHGHNALGVGEITFSLDFEDMDDEGEIGQLRHDLDLLFGGDNEN